MSITSRPTPKMAKRIECDDIETGKRAKKYRETKRVTLGEVAEHLITRSGAKFTNKLCHAYESGRVHWTVEFFNKYIDAVDAVVARYEGTVKGV